MAGGDAAAAQLHGVIEKGLELDLGVAQHVRVGRAPGGILAQEVGKHPVLVFGGKIYHLQLDADDIGDRSNVNQVLPRRAVFIIIVVLPVLHEQADDVEALLLEQQGGDRRVYPAGHANDDAFLGSRWTGRVHIPILLAWGAVSKGAVLNGSCLR